MSTPSTAIESVLVENRVFSPSEATVKAARISGMDAYNALCAEAAADFEMCIRDSIHSAGLKPCQRARS